MLFRIDLWYYSYLSALFCSWIEQYPLHFHPYKHPWCCCPTGGWCTWDCAVCSSVTNSSVHPTHLSIHIVFFQHTSRFFLLEVWTMFKSLICFPYSLSDWLLLLLLTAITSVLCIIKIFPIWVVCHGYWKSAVCSIPKCRKGRYLYCNWINITFSLKGTFTLTETTSNGDC